LEFKGSVFEGAWLELPTAFKKDLVMIMMRSQKEFQFKVGFFDVSLQQFNKV
jgi:hypothetical protein